LIQFIGGTALRVSDHFDQSEFNCPCGCGQKWDKKDELLRILEDARSHFGRPVIVTSGERCFEHNEEVQKEADPDYVPGSSKSQHMLGTAADIVVVGVPAREVSRYLDAKYPKRFGIGRYNGFTHIDIRPYRARWGW
jgi:uncharacterized protein YcbK (DUF882 family)